MLLPAGLNAAGMKQALAPDACSVKQVFRPAAQGAGQPFADRDIEALLRPLEKGFGQVAAEHPPQWHFTLAVTDLDGGGTAPRELDDGIVEKQTSSLQAGRHCRAVELDQNIAGQIAGHVAIDEPANRVGER